MGNESYKIRPGWAPNPVFDAAKAYLDVAEGAYSREAAKTRFLDFQNWFVVHHLGVIATELFIKSFLVTVSHPPVTDDSGPSEKIITHAYNVHQTSLDELDSKDEDGLKDYLPDHLFKLLESVSSFKEAKFEIARGRYPYQDRKDRKGSPSFPAGKAGQELASNWLELARALSKYQGLP